MPFYEIALPLPHIHFCLIFFFKSPRFEPVAAKVKLSPQPPSHANTTSQSINVKSLSWMFGFGQRSNKRRKIDSKFSNNFLNSLSLHLVWTRIRSKELSFDRSLNLHRMVDSGEVTVVVVAAAAAAVAQSVKRPVLRSLKEVQLSRRKLDSPS